MAETVTSERPTFRTPHRLIEGLIRDDVHAWAEEVGIAGWPVVDVAGAVAVSTYTRGATLQAAVEEGKAVCRAYVARPRRDR